MLERTRNVSIGWPVSASLTVPRMRSGLGTASLNTASLSAGSIVSSAWR